MPQPSAPPPPPFPTHRAAGAAPSSQLWPPFSSFSHSFPSSPPPPPPSGPARCTAPPPGAYRPPCASAGRPPAPSVSSCASQPPAFGSAGGQTSRPSPSPPPPSASPSLAPPSLPPRPAFAAAGSHWAGGPSAVPPPPSQSSVSPPPPPCASSLSAASAASPSALGRCLRAHSAGAESAGAASERRCCSWCAPAPPACPACSCQAAPAASAPAASCAGCAACCSPSHASAFQRCASHAPPCPPGSSACARCCGAASATCSVPPPPPPPSFSPPQAHDAAARVAQGAPPLRPPPAFWGPPGVPTGLPRTGAAASGSDGSAAVCAPSPPAAGGEDACCWPGRQQEATSPAGAADGAAVSAHPPPPSPRAWNAPSPSPAPPPGHQGATGAGVAPVSAAEPTRRDGCYGGSAVPPPPPPASEANVGARAVPWAGKRQGAWEGQDASAKKRRKEDEFVCLICDKTFRSAKRQQHHEEEEHLPCDYPGCTYSGPVHVMVMHKLKHLKNEKGESLLDSESEVAAWLAARKENFPSFRKNPKPKTPGPARPPPRPKSVLERILRETMESAYGRRLIHPAFFSSAFCPELPKMLAAPPPIYSLKREFRYATLPRSPYSHPSGLCPSSFLLPPGAKGPGRDVRSTGRGSGPEVPLRPPLLYQLLAPEIRGYEVKLIAAIQFIVQSNFFMNEPRAEAEKERLIEVVEEKAVDGETDDCAQGSHAAAQAIAAEGEGATD
ncbi:hypothetical protein BESB_055450 [Besnoitia besnoiti]|uniref:C2H2-type domain-containing protein n=1 Tax=Besnoitia besnoiti TaxID=94643 RepID=A0A2A9MFB7_BESBE|nr:hypothetical protein BESB_055450 [Besnoitia besnoiti]PFH35894.1 hypothetical protein BESB_055450 [Besnoitia besnoiti]